MGFYKVRRDDYLEHFGFKKKHKYVKKIGSGKDARYFYSDAEYQAYLSNKSDNKVIPGNYNKYSFENYVQAYVNAYAPQYSEATDHFFYKVHEKRDDIKNVKESVVKGAKAGRFVYGQTKDVKRALSSAKNAYQMNRSRRKISSVLNNYGTTTIEQIGEYVHQYQDGHTASFPVTAEVHESKPSNKKKRPRGRKIYNTGEGLGVSVSKRP